MRAGSSLFYRTVHLDFCLQRCIVAMIKASIQGALCYWEMKSTSLHCTFRHRHLWFFLYNILPLCPKPSMQFSIRQQQQQQNHKDKGLIPRETIVFVREHDDSCLICTLPAWMSVMGGHWQAWLMTISIHCCTVGQSLNQGVQKMKSANEMFMCFILICWSEMFVSYS